MKDLWNNDPIHWAGMSLVDRLEYLRKWYCTGPCGQSNSVLGTRYATNNTISEAISVLKFLKHKNEA